MVAKLVRGQMQDNGGVASPRDPARGVIPAKARIHVARTNMDLRFRGDDVNVYVTTLLAVKSRHAPLSTISRMAATASSSSSSLV